MTDREGKLFEWLEPPPGGLAALRARLDHEPVRLERRRHLVAAVGLAASVLVVLLISLARPDAVQDASRRAFAERVATSTHPRLLRAGLVARPIDTVSVSVTASDRMAVLRVPVSEPHVDFFLFASSLEQSLPPAPEPPSGDR